MSVRVLIVDDDAGFRRVATELCRARGFTVVGEAVDAASALATADEVGPDWVLLDVGLPDRSGLDVSWELTRRLDASRVLLTSNDVEQWSPEDVRSSGAEGLVRKDDLVAFDLIGLFNSADSAAPRAPADAVPPSPAADRAC